MYGLVKTLVFDICIILLAPVLRRDHSSPSKSVTIYSHQLFSWKGWVQRFEDFFRETLFLPLKTSSRGAQDVFVKLFFLRHIYEYVFPVSLQDLLKIFWRDLEDVLKASHCTLRKNLVFWRRLRKSILIFCSASVKYTIHRLVASHVRDKTSWTNYAKFWWPLFAMTTFSAESLKKPILLGQEKNLKVLNCLKISLIMFFSDI